MIDFHHNLRMYKLRIKSPIILNLFLWLYPQLEEIIGKLTAISLVKRVAFFKPKMLSFFRVAPKRVPRPGEVPKMTRIFDAVHMYVYVCIYVYPGSQQPFKKWWFLLDDDKSLLK